MVVQERTLPNVTHPPVSAPASSRFKLVDGDLRCAVRAVFDHIAEKWAALIVTIHAEGPMGYSELRRSAAGVSDKMLAQTLQKLERSGLVSREVHTGKPIRVDYALTALGASLVPPLAALRNWADRHGEELASHQTTWDDEH